MICYRSKMNNERLVLVKRRKGVSVFKCVDRPMEQMCSGVMDHPRIVVSDVRINDVVKECKE